MRTRLFGSKTIAIGTTVALVGTATSAWLLVRTPPGISDGLDPGAPAAMGALPRFAAMSFGAASGDAVLAATGTVGADPDPIQPPGPPSVVTEYRTPNGWRLRPAGTQIDTQRAPTGLSVSPDKSTVFVVTSGVFNEHLVAIDAETFASTETQVGSLFMGVTADESNDLWASGGFRNRIYQFKYEGPVSGGIRQVGPFPGSPDSGIPVIGYPGNMVLSGDEDRGFRLFVAGNLSVPTDYIKESFPDADGCTDSSICSVVNIIDVTDPNDQSPPVNVAPVGRDAYGIAVNEAAGLLYVSNWADETNPARAGGRGTVSIVDISEPGAEHEIAVVPVGHHPTGIALSPNGKRLAVANSADDTVSLLSLNASGMVRGRKTVSVKTTRRAPRGATPLAVAFTPNNKALYVLLAGQNAIEVRKSNGRRIPRKVRVGEGPNATTLKVPHTYIPTGWYPSALALAPHPSAEGLRIYVTNLKGIGAGPGLNAQAEPLVGSRTQGTLSIIDRPAKGQRRKAFNRWTATVVENNKWGPLFDRRVRSAAANPCRPAPLPDGSKTFSRLLCKTSRGRIDAHKLHVVYIVKENKTFDQYFGDIKATLPDADADPTWLLYGEAVTTNQHDLARRFALSDNFWADSEQSTTGHSWTSAGYATEYNEITWNPEYSQGLRGHRWQGQYEGGTSGASDEEIAEQEGELFEPEERLVDIFADDRDNPKGYTFRIYSDDVEEESEAVQWRVPLAMWGLGTSAVHHGRDLDFPDEDRARIFLNGKTISHAWSADQGQGPPPQYGQEISLSKKNKRKFTLDAWSKAYKSCRRGGRSDARCQRVMPNFIYMALPVDHTLGFNPNYPTPASMVADNDKATGMIVEGLSKSPFWKNTLIFITEDDTQAAGDHVDAHRTFLLTVGGLARRLGPEGKVSHQAGSFPSILKTVEVVFDLPPLTIYDRAAVPLHDVVVRSFRKTNAVRYRALEPPTPFELNPEGTDLARLSQMLDWRLDMTDPYMLRDLLYHGLRGWPLPDRYDRLLD